MNEINQIFELHKLAIEGVKKYPERRFLFESVKNDSGPHILGITGLRGTGKSIILKQIAAIYSDSIYISLDSIGDVDLFAVIKKLSSDYGVKTFLLDEVHFFKNIDAVLKKIYDFLDVKIIFTSSVALGMFHSAYDLSRRVKLIEIYPFSFREYLFFEKGEELSSLTIEDIRNKRYNSNHLKNEYAFEEYLKGGNLPFSIEEPDFLPLLRNILLTVINQDIPRIAKLAVDELDLIYKMVEFIGKSEVDGINYSSIAKNIGITKYKAQSYLDLLEKCFILHKILPAGTNVLKEPKILLAPPFRLLFKEYDECIGALREDFIVEMLAASGIQYNYLKTTRGAKTPDFLIDDGGVRYIIEVGGKGKGREQFKGIKENKQIIFTHSSRFDTIRRPLFLAGFLS